MRYNLTVSKDLKSQEKKFIVKYPYTLKYIQTSHSLYDCLNITSVGV